MLCLVGTALLFAWSSETASAVDDLAKPVAPGVTTFVSKYCFECHADANDVTHLNLKSLATQPVTAQSDAWEKVIRKLRSRQMPPVGSLRPTDAEYDSVSEIIDHELDEQFDSNPLPGRTDSLRRLTRMEYQNAIRDLLALQIDAALLLPADESSHGFDNITVGELSPTLLNRYVSAAQKIARLTVGGTSREPSGESFRVRPDITQEDHMPGLPLGTRGGTLITYNFPQDGEYDVQVLLTRDRNENVEGLSGKHEMVVLLDRREVSRFTVQPPKDGNDHSHVDAHLALRLNAKAGEHQLGVTFVRKSDSIQETVRQPYQARFNMHRHPRTSPAVFQVSVVGPFDPAGPGDSSSRQRLFVSIPANLEAEDASAKEILSTLLRRAYRRPIDDADLAQPLQFFRNARNNFENSSREGEAAFDAGIEAALATVLVNPNFLFRIERDPAGLKSGDVYRITDLELASRLSFFLWSSIPDDELLALAEQNTLSQPDVLDQQVKRMLADPRAESLVSNFADQWLYLRNLDSVFPDMRLFPDFDDNLRQAMRRETELFFASIMQEDRSVLGLLRADYTFLNERLAKHYSIPHIYGDHFRRVELQPETHRGGLLRHASILTVTSYATRTSPVIRGHWILKNLVGSPPPPPPDNVPALKDNTVLDSLPIRQRLAQHRADPNCAGCHNLMDPVGFSLENFDAVGRWRERDEEHLVDALGGLPDGSEFTGVDGLEQGLLQRPELFVSTLTEKLMTYALGRGVENSDAPAVRKIVRDARTLKKVSGTLEAPEEHRENSVPESSRHLFQSPVDYHFSSLIQGIVRSIPFQMRTAE